MKKNTPIILYVFFGLLLLVNFLGWQKSRYYEASWANVPPALSERQAIAGTLGDKQLAYRTNAIMLTNLGSMGGNIQKLNDYNYETLTDWFYLEDKLDPEARYIPYLATYYYSAAENPDSLRELVPYIEYIGSKQDAGWWHYMLQAIFIAKHKIKDLDLALRLSQKLALSSQPDIPVWVRQMPAFVYMDKGEKEEAYTLLKNVLISEKDALPKEEIYNIVLIICKRVLSEKEASQDPICQPLQQNKE